MVEILILWTLAIIGGGILILFLSGIWAESRHKKAAHRLLRETNPEPKDIERTIKGLLDRISKDDPVEYKSEAESKEVEELIRRLRAKQNYLRRQNRG